MPSAERTRASIRALVDANEFYAAHQKYRTTAARLLKAPPSSEPLPFDAKAQEAAELLWEGSRSLLEKGEGGSGTDLALYMIETWSTRAVSCGDAERAKIRQLLVLVGSGNTWRKSIADAAINWSSKTGTCPAGDLTIHADYGAILVKDKDYVGAEPHLVASATRDSARQLAEILYAWSQVDPAPVANLGRYAARGTLSLLESEAILAAHTFLDRFLDLALAAHPELVVKRAEGANGITTTSAPSLNFLQLVIKTCQVGAGEPLAPTNASGQPNRAGMGRAAWQALVGRYEREVPWLREPDAKESREILSQQFFGIKPPKGGNDMISNLMSGLFGGGGGGGGAGNARPAAGRIASPGLD